MAAARLGHALLAVLFASSHAYTFGRVPQLAIAQSRSPRAAIPAMQAEDPVPAEPEPEVSPSEAPAEPPAEPPLDEVDEFDEFDEGTIAKEALKAEVADGLLGSRPDRAVVGEILLALEACNPTRSPATSPLLNGKWKIVFASGVSPGLKAFQLLLKSAKRAPKSPSGADIVDVEDAYLTIGPDQPRCESSVATRVLSLENTVKLTSRLEAESAVRLLETYDAAQSEYLSLRLPFSSPLQYKRSLLVSYLDEELLVVRDASGRPDVLMRCDVPAAPAPATSAMEVDEEDSTPSDS